jgi:hypothetical protein
MLAQTGQMNNRWNPITERKRSVRRGEQLAVQMTGESEPSKNKQAGKGSPVGWGGSGA